MLSQKGFQNSFLPGLFWGATSKVLAQGVTQLPVKQVGLAITNPNLSDLDNWTASCIVIGHLIADLRGRTEFNTRNHTLLLQEGRWEIRR